jgi:hypothetical protein
MRVEYRSWSDAVRGAAARSIPSGDGPESLESLLWRRCGARDLLSKTFSKKKGAEFELRGVPGRDALG